MNAAGNTSKPLVGIVIPNYNGTQVTCDCLGSFQNLDYPNFRIFLVENGSDDKPADFFRKKYPHVRVIESPINLGFAAGCNLGIKHALAEDAEFILLLNNDTIVAPDFLSKMLNTIKPDPHGKMVGPKIRYFEPNNRFWFAGGSYNLWQGIPDHIGEGEEDRGQYNSPREVSFLTGCCILISRALIEKIGLLREDLYMIAEDLDWCLKARRAGARLVYCPSAVIWHKESFTTQKVLGNPRQLYLATRNLLLVHQEHARWYHNIAFYPWFAMRWMLYQSLKHLLRGKPLMLKALCLAARDFLKGRAGLPPEI